MPPSPVFLPLRSLSESIRARRLSPVELASNFLDRLERLGPTYNAVVTVTRELALAQAQAAEREIAAGRYKGPLHGIPYGAKDLLATAGGIPTTGALSRASRSAVGRSRQVQTKAAPSLVSTTRP